MQSPDPKAFLQDFEENRIAKAKSGRRHRRVVYFQPVRVKFDGKRDRRAVLKDISVRGCGLFFHARPDVGDHAEIRIPDFGTLRGRVAGHFVDGIGIAFTGNKAERRARADSLMVFLNGPDKGERAIRYPSGAHEIMQTMQGERIECIIENISETGISLNTPVLPSVGENVRIGKRHGTVVRHHQTGIGVHFSAPAQLTDEEKNGR